MFGQMRRVAAITGAAVLTTAVLAGGVLAAPAAAEEGAKGGKYTEVFVTKLAALLNVDTTVLVSSIKQAGAATVDEAVAAGDLDQTAGAKLKERIEAGKFPTFGGGVRKDNGKGKGQQGGIQGILNPGEIGGALAVRLGLSTEQLRLELKSGKSLHQLGEEKGVSDADLKAVILGVVQPKLAQAVTDGKLTQAQADKVVARIQNADLTGKVLGIGGKPARDDDGKGKGKGDRGQNGKGKGKGQD